MVVDTIVSLATAPGIGAVALVRMSGPRSDSVLQALLGEGGALPEARRASLCDIHDTGADGLLDRALVTRFVGPASFTGEDVVEIACHGGWLLPGLVVEACVRNGARQAEPGEFTRRAYLNGRLDLVQAEGIADLVAARSRAMHRAALGQLERGLSRRVASLRERLLKVEALLAHHVDFPEEDDAPAPIDVVLGEATRLVEQVDAMLRTAPEGELLREGALAVFAGRPNAGKSSLYNALIGRERAIVTDVPGTTRDALEAVVQIGGFPFRLVDTAGLRSSPGRIEQMGIEIALGYVERADVVLFCVPADEEVTDEDRDFLAGVRSAPVVLVRTKHDLLAEAKGSGGIPVGVAQAVSVSVESGEGLGSLRTVLPSLVYSALIHNEGEAPVITRARQSTALHRARGEIEAFRTGLLEGLPAEIAATHLREAEGALEELVGTVQVDDVLDVVFREFCVGK